MTDIEELKRLPLMQYPPNIVTKLRRIPKSAACPDLDDERITLMVGATAHEAAAAIEHLQRELEEARKDAERMDWIIDNYTSTGGGNGFELRVWIPHDSECVRDAIDHARQQTG